MARRSSKTAPKPKTKSQPPKLRRFNFEIRAIIGFQIISASAADAYGHALEAFYQLRQQTPPVPTGPYNSFIIVSGEAPELASFEVISDG